MYLSPFSLSVKIVEEGNILTISFVNLSIILFKLLVIKQVVNIIKKIFNLMLIYHINFALFEKEHFNAENLDKI